MRARLRELPDGEFHASDFLEHDGHTNALYKIDVKLTKRGEKLALDFSGSSKQAPGFINATRAGLRGGVAGGILPILAYDMQWNQGALSPVEIVAPDGLICTAQFPAPVGAATVEAIWVVCNATTLALNKLLATSDKYRPRVQGITDGCMATFNLGGVNQYGEPFGLHLMDPIAGGAGAYASKDGVDAGGPITSPVSSIADIERNEQVSPLFYLHRRLALDTAGAGRFRGGVSGEVALTLGGIERAYALIMTHGAEVPNDAGLGGGWPGSTVRQAMGRGAIKNGRPQKTVKWERFGPKPGLMVMTNRDVFQVSWQGGGGWGDPLDREPASVARDVERGAVSPEAARRIYGVAMKASRVDAKATDALRRKLKQQRVGKLAKNPAKFCKAEPFASLSENLFLARDARGTHVVTKVGYILSTGSTRWRRGAVARTMTKLPAEHHVALHENLAMTAFCCPASGTLLSVDVHERGKPVRDDVVLDLAAAERLYGIRRPPVKEAAE